MEQLFYFEHSQILAQKLSKATHIPLGAFDYRRFPDDESYIRVQTDVTGKRVGVVCGLEYPDMKLIPLYFLVKTLKELGVSHVTLISPYLSYMRQDKRFQPGEAITSNYFASLLSEFVDELITIDPHLHRHHNLSEIYTIPTHLLHAAPLVSEWIKNTVSNPIIVGPDGESEQWVSDVASMADCPYVVLEKVRHGDRNVEITFPQLERYRSYTPVLVDDIISTARTMIKTVTHLNSLQLAPPVCIGVHGLFSGDAFDALKQSGVGDIVTTTAIPHTSNKIDITPLITSCLEEKS